MEINVKSDKRIDPVGIELGLAILSTTITVISFLKEFVPLLKRRREFREKLIAIRQEVFSLQNSLDDFILTLERLSHQDEEFSLRERTLTIAGTLFRLRERDYRRWIDVQDSIKSIDHRIYHMGGIHFALVIIYNII